MKKNIKKIITLGIFFSIMLVLAFILPNQAKAYYTGLCTYHAYQTCSGNNLYWYDSCGNQQEVAQYCSNGCYNNTCYTDNNYNNYNNYNNCTYHAYKLCSGNNIFWYNSCGTQQDLYSTCSGNLVCQYGQCVLPTINPVIPPVNNYTVYYRTACYNNSVYWYDSLGAISGLNKNCNDNNSCTIDSCSDKNCLNTLKCDGSTCASGSADFVKYCPTAPVENKCGNGLCEANIGETPETCVNDCKVNNISALSISFFVKQDPTASQWQKNAQVGSNGQLYMMIGVTNNSANQVDNVKVSANIPSEISQLGNLQLNGIAISGDIVSGIIIGSVAPNSTKTITFEGKTQTIPSSTEKTGTATINSDSPQTDSILLNFSPTQFAAGVLPIAESSGFVDFLKKWYLWIIAGMILVFLFIIVFKKLSSDV